MSDTLIPDDRLILEARRARLNEGLLNLSKWCMERAHSAANEDTTLTMLEKKATGLRHKIQKAGWAAVALKVESTTPQ